MIEGICYSFVQGSLLWFRVCVCVCVCVCVGVCVWACTHSPGFYQHSFILCSHRFDSMSSLGLYPHIMIVYNKPSSPSPSLSPGHEYPPAAIAGSLLYILMNGVLESLHIYRGGSIFFPTSLHLLFVSALFVRVLSNCITASLLNARVRWFETCVGSFCFCFFFLSSSSSSFDKKKWANQLNNVENAAQQHRLSIAQFRRTALFSPCCPIPVPDLCLIFFDCVASEMKAAVTRNLHNTNSFFSLRPSPFVFNTNYGVLNCS